MPACMVQVYCSAAKRSVLALLALPAEDMALLTDDPCQVRAHGCHAWPHASRTLRQDVAFPSLPTPPPTTS